MHESEIVIDRCPVEETMKLISKKWVIQLVRDMFFGKSHFNEFKEDKPNLSNKVLSNCLKDMEKNGLITKNVGADSMNTEYKLTNKGLSLNKVIYELASFTLVNDLDNKYYDEESKKYIDNLFKSALNIS